MGGPLQSATRCENEHRLGSEIVKLRADCSAAWRGGRSGVETVNLHPAADMATFTDPRHKRFK